MVLRLPIDVSVDKGDKWNVKKKGYLKIHIACKRQEQENSFHDGNCR